MLGALLVAGAGVVALLLWDPHPRTDRSYDRGRNGLWLGHKWYTGRDIRSGESVEPSDVRSLRQSLARHGIRYAYVHVGPVLADGSIEDAAGPLFRGLREAAHDVVFLAWMGARVEKVPMGDPRFVERILATIQALREEGFAGVHFDFEPLADGDVDYLALLRAVRDRYGSDLFVGQATPRAGPFGQSLGPLRRSFWSKGYYLQTMRATDQTVVMAYDSRLTFPKGYMEFVRHQTGLLADWACSIPGHELLIGVPSYEDVPTYSDPQVENLRTATLGVRAALEERRGDAPCLSGVAIYANWVTDEAEWRDYRRFWMTPGRDVPGS